MRKKLFVFIALLIFFISFFFIKYNVQNNTDLFYKYKKKIPLVIKKQIRFVLTSINNIYIYRVNDFNFEKRKDKIVFDDTNPKRNLTLYSNSNLIFTGPRAYFASNDKNLYLITGTGILMSIKKNDITTKKNNFSLKKINTNLPYFLSKYKNKFSFYYKTSMVKNLLHKDGYLYVSLVRKINENCYKHLIVRGKLKKNDILFKEFFTLQDCRIFYSDYVGGNLADYKNDKILYTVGDWAICEDFRWLKKGKGFCTKNNSQNLSSTLGKFYEININTRESKIISIGHDNPQGITYDHVNDIIFSTEHGPQGGDELNININPSTIEVKNFGFPISSYGEHYGYPSEGVRYKYEEAPFYKSHKEYGFVEPLDYFVPSIGISDIEKIDNKLYVASMGSDIEHGDLSLHIYTLDLDQKVKKKEILKVYERIRDIHVIENFILFFFETTGTIAIYERN